jgi:hypothetical protein
LLHKLFSQEIAQQNGGAGFSWARHSIEIDGVDAPLSIWENTKQEQYGGILPLTLRDTEIALLTFALDNRMSFASLWEYIRRSKAKT